MIATLATRSNNRWAAPIAGLGSAYYLLASRGWEGEWQGGVQAATNALIFMLPAVMIGSALDGRRYFGTRSQRPARMARLLVERRVLTIFASALAWPLLVIASLISVTFVLNATVSGFHFPGFLPLLLPVTWIGLYIALGLLVSQHLQPILVVPLAAVLGFVLPVLAASEPDRRPNLFTLLDDGAVSVPIFLSPLALATQGAIFVGSIAVFLTLVGGRWGISTTFGAVRKKFRRGPVIVCVVAASAVILAAAIGPTNRRYEELSGSGPRECQMADGLTICVWSDHRPLLSFAVEQAPRIDQALTFWDSRPEEYLERGLSPDASSSDFATGTTFGNDESLGRALVVGVVSRLACGSKQVVYSPEVGEREEWVLIRSGIIEPRALSTSVKAILELPPRAQTSWWLELSTLNNECF